MRCRAHSSHLNQSVLVVNTSLFILLSQDAEDLLSLVVMQHNLDMTRVYQFLFETFPQRVLQCFETVVVRKGEIENRNPEFRLKNRFIIRQ